jgi:hypothetical protein
MSLSNFFNTYLYFMNEAKIRLSPEEQELVNNAGWILTKNNILKKAWDLLNSLQQMQEQNLQHSPLSNELGIQSPKISKGENYMGLPYLVLDFPRIFQHENIFAIRTMFWWGNFFSSTLHLSGIHKQLHEERVINAYPHLSEGGFYYCIYDEPWEHHFELNNYRKISEINRDDFERLVLKKPFLKLSNKISLDHWEDAPANLLHFFNQYMEMIRT